MKGHRNISNAERQQMILQMVERGERITVRKVCEQFDISEATARRDLESLAEQGRLRRVHGGAMAIDNAPPELPIHERSAEQANEKRRIGQKAAESITEHETIFLGSGTTVLELARALIERENLTVITNSLPVINTLARSKGINLVCVGGYFRANELSFIGHITEQSLAEVRADKVFTGIRAIDPVTGLTSAYLPETMTDRAILHISREAILLADHTKFGRVSAAFLAPVNVIHTIITDDQAPYDLTAAIEAQGVKIIRA